jgi:chemotaxis protein methyltransferase CheR
MVHVAMTDGECVRFLQWALPRLGLRWAGFRKVRRQVCRRVQRRLVELGLAGPDAYRAHLERNPDEWAVLDALTHITISRFYRDREVFDGLRAEVLPRLARTALADGRARLTVWSAGAAGGEEAYTVALAWDLELAERFAPLRLHVLATDVDETMLARARAARYTGGSVKDLPDEWRRDAFVERDGVLCLRPEPRRAVELRRHDVRRTPPPVDELDLVLCRYLAFTYFGPELQLTAARRLAGALRPGGALVLGTHEALPAGVEDVEPWPGLRWTYRRR